MAYQMASLKIEMKEVVHVKPSKPTPSIVLPLSALEHRPYPDSIWPIVHVYQSPSNGQLDPAFVLKQALSKALVYYYPLAGKLVKQPNGKVAINCNNDGVPFLEAIANCELSSLNYLDDHDIRIAKQLVFDFHPQQDENEYPHPVSFKLTKFQCGGFTIGMSTSHIVCDGWGACKFFHAIVELASGKSEPFLKPVWERERLIGSITTQPMPNPMDETTAAVSPFLPATDVMYELFKVDKESIRRLKMSLMKEISCNESMEQSFTTFESLAAYVWRSRARALNLNNEGKTLLVFSVQVRQHMSPPLSDGYYGTAITEGQVVLTMKELNEKPLSDIVKLVKESKNVAFTGDFIKKTIDTLESNPENFNVEEGPGATLALSDWKHLGFMPNVDFGWKEPINMVPAPCNMFEYEGLCIFLSPSNHDPSMEGGVRVFISLPSVAMPKFKEEMEALKVITP
ncbi:hypothetical protein Lal_00001131 [Lupinus albus]|uniref:Inactive tetrahydroanabasine acetyltransferase pauper allele n=1 Tax=Lupinus albus TaxID=3870 RepID=ITHAT_LUPAL|nr:putative taxadien-5-alpha-ol O-acetyltransferase [Lupinus albus]KAF1890997.1 hypothetical protein Lal_00001131 [Lupinus albus]